MAHDRRFIADLESAKQVLVGLVGVGHPLVLALMIQPAFNDGRLHDPAWFRDVLPQVPADRAVTSAGGAEAA